VQEFLEDGQFEIVTGPSDEFLEIDFGDGTDWV
jgi:hypothetical protein